jgi:flavin-dependent thymidylate synthase
MKNLSVQLIDYTGAGAADPARHAANVLVFTKQTRLNMTADLMSEIEKWPEERIEAELAYMAKTLPSSWEFVEYKFLINGVTRAFTHQLVRTRTGAYAQQAMRILDVKGWTYDTGPTIQESPSRKHMYDDGMAAISEAYNALVEDGASIQDARGVLPTNIQTNICARFDLRVLTDLTRKRASSRVQGEYREVVEQMKSEVYRVHPWARQFFERPFDVLAAELDALLADSELCDEATTRAVKIIDQMRGGAA